MREIICGLFVLVALAATASGAAAGDAPGAQQLVFRDVIDVFGDEPVTLPVEGAERVAVVFKAGELEVATEPIDAVRTELHVVCKELSEATCARYRKKVRLSSRLDDGTLTVRLVGISLWQMRKLGVTGRVVVPARLPLNVKMGFGELEVLGADRDLGVSLGAGDVTVRAQRDETRSVDIDTRIGDASLAAGAASMEGRRRRLLGARIRWGEGEGSARIRVALRVGDATVVLD